MNDEKKEIDALKKLQEDAQKDIQKAAYRSMVLMGEEWTRDHGPDGLAKEMLNIRAFIKSWNDISHTAIPFNLQTIDVMLAAIANVPVSARSPQLAASPHYINFYSIFSAVRNELMRGRDAKLKAAGMPPELSTPGAENIKPML